MRWFLMCKDQPLSVNASRSRHQARFAFKISSMLVTGSTFARFLLRIFIGFCVGKSRCCQNFLNKQSIGHQFVI